MRTGRCVLYGIVHKIDDHLYNEPGITSCQKQVILVEDGDDMVGTASVGVLNCFGHDFLHKLGLHIQFHSAIFNFGYRQ